MSQPHETQVSMKSIIEVQRRKIAQLLEQTVMLEAALEDREQELIALREQKS